MLQQPQEKITEDLGIAWCGMFDLPQQSHDSLLQNGSTCERKTINLIKHSLQLMPIRNAIIQFIAIYRLTK